MCIIYAAWGLREHCELRDGVVKIGLASSLACRDTRTTHSRGC